MWPQCQIQRLRSCLKVKYKNIMQSDAMSSACMKRKPSSRPALFPLRTLQEPQCYWQASNIRFWCWSCCFSFSPPEFLGGEIQPYNKNSPFISHVEFVFLTFHVFRLVTRQGEIPTRPVWDFETETGSGPVQNWCCHQRWDEMVWRSRPHSNTFL